MLNHAFSIKTGPAKIGTTLGRVAHFDEVAWFDCLKGLLTGVEMGFQVSKAVRRSAEKYDRDFASC